MTRRPTGRELRGAARLARTLARRPRDLADLPAWALSLARRPDPLAARRPWLPYAAARMIAAHVDRSSVVWEYGSGGSTLWLAARVGALTSVEHDPAWHARVRDELRGASLTNCRLLLVEPAGEEPRFAPYVETIRSQPAGGLDLVLVDGRSRAACMVEAASRVRPGGLLVLDDSERPRYRAGTSALDDWPRRDVWGLKPGATHPAWTSFWRRPSVRRAAERPRGRRYTEPVPPT